MEWKSFGAWGLAAATLGMISAAMPAEALACGCFAPPNPATPVVQAGEQVVFAQKDGKVTMHVRVRYSGPAEDFAWLLPLPAVPELEISTEELFVALGQRTAPQYFLQRDFEGQCNFGVDAGSAAVDGGAPPNSGGPDNVLVQRQAVGPYDTAVLRADDRDEMLAWLRDNGYFVPDEIGAATAPYIAPGAYFLALKLQKDKEAGDIAPIALEYDSDLPMIPMTLTQVGAEEDMPLTVWVLGEHRAIPRNYRHTILNEAYIDWFTGGSNYVEVVTEAVDEADGAHSFVTEYAGSVDRMRDVLDGPQRFGDRADFESATEALEYVQMLRGRGFLWTSTLVDFLRETFPMPDAVRDAGFDPDTYYANLDWFLGVYRDRNPEQFEGADFSFDAEVLTERIWAAIVEPARRAGRLFSEHPKMTRLFTTLSPHEMNADPVFSFNPDLPDVDNVHRAAFNVTCSSGQVPDTGELVLPDGRIYTTSRADWQAAIAARNTPFSARVEILREEGAPEVEVDNTDRLGPGGDSGLTPGNGPGSAERGDGCTGVPASTGFVGVLLLAGLGWATRRR